MSTPARILLIDDDPDMHDTVGMILSLDGHRLAGSKTGAEGLEAMRRDPPDLVLLDIMLTYPSEGVQVACQMRQDDRLRQIPIIFMSAMGEEFEQVYAREGCPVALDADMFLEKPLDAKTLRDAVNFVLQTNSQ